VESARPAADPLCFEVDDMDGSLRARFQGRTVAQSEKPVDFVRALNHEIVMELMLRRRDLFFVHSAVVSNLGSGIALPGASGAGKSTLAFALVRRGYGFLSDELLAYEPLTRTALPFP